MDKNISLIFAKYILDNKPCAVASIKGSDDFNDLRGTVSFYSLLNKTLVTAEVIGLPNADTICANSVFGFHIHSGTVCTGNTEDPFANAKAHYDTTGCPHPYHSGDMPPLFGTPDNGWMAFLTNRFSVAEVIGKTVIIHSMPDDFHTQPSGNSGKKIACGIIEKI